MCGRYEYNYYVVAVLVTVYTTMQSPLVYLVLLISITMALPVPTYIAAVKLRHCTLELDVILLYMITNTWATP